MMGPGILLRKFARNLYDYGWSSALKKSAQWLLSPLFSRTVYTIYVIDLNAPAARQTAGRSDLDYILLGAEDAALIAQVEGYAEWLRGRMRRRLAGGALCLVAAQGEKVAGFNLVAFDEAYIPLLGTARRFRPGTAWSDHIAVSPAFRRNGVAQSLRRKIFEELRRRGVRRLYGGTLRSNVAALELARGLGFREVADVTYWKILRWKSWQHRRCRRPVAAAPAARAPVGPRVLMLLENACYPHDSRVRREAQTLVSAGYAVTVICPAWPGQSWHEVLDGVELWRYPRPSGGGGLLGYLWEYGYSMTASLALSLLVLFRRGFDVVHAHNPPDLFVLLGMLYKVLGKRFLFDHHDIAPEMYFARFGGKGHRAVWRALLFFEWLSCRAADHVIATNDSYKALECQRDGVAPDRVTVVRNGPQPERFQDARPDPALRAKAGTIIGYVGVMSVQDGLDYLLRALAHLVADLKRTDVYCVLVGHGSAWEDLQRLAAELGLQGHVWFPGYVSFRELKSYLATADILVAPDPKNDFADRSTMIKLMEYMVLGKPMVAFDLTEHRVTAQGAALYAAPNDELDFARKIAILMDNPEMRAEMGRLGQCRARAELAWARQAPHLLAAYEKLALARPAPRLTEETAHP